MEDFFKENVKTCNKCQLSLKQDPNGKWSPIYTERWGIKRAEYYGKHLRLPPVCETCKW